LRADIKRAIGYQKIRNFSELVSSCRIYEEDTKAHYKVMSERRGKGQQSRPKPYSAPADKGKQRLNDERRPKGRDAPTEIVCFKCGEKGHKSNVCGRDEKKCFQCGKKGHMVTECKRDEKTQASGKVFALTGTQTSNEDRLIRGTCFFNSILLLIAIIDTGATHCFIAFDCAHKLGLVMSDMKEEMVVETPAKGSVTTSLVCLSCLLSMFGRNFEVDLVCVTPRSQKYVI